MVLATSVSRVSPGETYTLEEPRGFQTFSQPLLVPTNGQPHMVGFSRSAQTGFRVSITRERDRRLCNSQSKRRTKDCHVVVAPKRSGATRRDPAHNGCFCGQWRRSVLTLDQSSSECEGSGYRDDLRTGMTESRARRGSATGCARISFLDKAFVSTLFPASAACSFAKPRLSR